MPTFCRHNRFIERCPICSATLPEHAPASTSPRAKRAARGPTAAPARRSRTRGEDLRIRREGRAEDDGYRSELVPGLRASADAHRLVEEVAFSSGRLLGLAAQPPALYGQARDLLADGDAERATWACFAIAYLGPLEGEDPFAGSRALLALTPTPAALADAGADVEALLADLPLGPRTSHEPARGTVTLDAYRQWTQRGGAGGGADRDGSAASVFVGDPAWSAQRRFERLFERLALPGFTRAGRYDLLVTLGRMGMYELSADSLHLGAGKGVATEDATTLAAKRLFGIGDPLLLQRRAARLADALEVTLESLDLALANWQAPPRATMGFPAETVDEDAYERAGDALDL
jgi:hypothetical protein